MSIVRDFLAPLLVCLLIALGFAVTVTAGTMLLDSRHCAEQGGTYTIDHDLAVTSHCRY